MLLIFLLLLKILLWQDKKDRPKSIVSWITLKLIKFGSVIIFSVARQHFYSKSVSLELRK